MVANKKDKDLVGKIIAELAGSGNPTKFAFAQTVVNQLAELDLARAQKLAANYGMELKPASSQTPKAGADKTSLQSMKKAGSLWSQPSQSKSTSAIPTPIPSPRLGR